jgi:hypothetical protein
MMDSRQKPETGSLRVCFGEGDRINSSSIRKRMECRTIGRVTYYIQLSIARVKLVNATFLYHGRNGNIGNDGDFTLII